MWYSFVFSFCCFCLLVLFHFFPDAVTEYPDKHNLSWKVFSSFCYFIGFNFFPTSLLHSSNSPTLGGREGKLEEKWAWIPLDYFLLICGIEFLGKSPVFNFKIPVTNNQPPMSRNSSNLLLQQLQVQQKEQQQEEEQGGAASAALGNLAFLYLLKVPYNSKCKVSSAGEIMLPPENEINNS